jgi:hypothetical protein
MSQAGQGGRTRPVDDLTRRVLLEWPSHRSTRWPSTANPHLLVNQMSANGTGPVSTSCFPKTGLRGMAATLERLRVDRQLQEALASGPDPCTWPRCSASTPRRPSATRKTPGNCSSRRPRSTKARPRPVDMRPGEGRRPRTGDDVLASVTETLARLTAAARGGGLDDTAALSALAAARLLAAELEPSELALIETARDGGATWSRIAVAMGARNRLTAQKRRTSSYRGTPEPSRVSTSRGHAAVLARE